MRTALPLRLASVALVGLFLGRWPFRSQHLYEWDSAQYALGTLDFDIYKHQPHPPGYPVWILFLKAVHLVVSDLNTMQVVAAFLACAVGAWVYYRFAAAVQGPALALLATACAFYAPPAIVASVTANTYPIDMLGSALLGWLAARMWNGEKRLAPLAAALIALMAGARQTGAVVLVPVVGIAMVLACRFDWRAWAKTALAGGVVFAAWFLPVAQMHGGIVKLQTYQTANARMFFSHWSYFHGAPLWVHLDMLREVRRWLVVMLGPTVVLCILIYAAGLALAPRASAERRRAVPSLRLGPWFYALWLAPSIVMCGLHCPKPGYLLVALPPIVLALTGLAGRGARRLAARFQVPTDSLVAGLAVVAALGSTALGSIRYHDPSYNRSSLSGVRQIDHGTDAILQAVGPRSEDQDATLVVVFARTMWFGANYRTLALDLDAELWHFQTEDLKRTARHHVEPPTWTPTTAHVIPDRIRRIVWIHDQQHELAAPILETFQGTRALADVPTRNVWVSEIGEQKLDVSFPLYDFAVHLVR